MQTRQRTRQWVSNGTRVLLLCILAALVTVRPIPLMKRGLLTVYVCPSRPCSGPSRPPSWLVDGNARTTFFDCAAAEALIGKG